MSPQDEVRMKQDFKAFLYAAFQFLGLGCPTKIQYDLAHYLQHGGDRIIIEAFRGVGKSLITSLFVLWCLYRDQQFKVLVISATSNRAANFTVFLLNMIQNVSWLQHLEPRDNQRRSTLQFDVDGAEPNQQPSVKCVGIGGSMVGNRANLIIPDDVESPKNSQTEAQRAKLSEAVKEFDAVLLPEGRVCYLGTPQCEFSLYNELQKRGYDCKIWPVRYPNAQQRSYYGDRLGPCIAKDVADNPKLVGKSTEPGRFTESDLRKREASYGRSGFDLQFMLDTRLGDQHKFPLRLSDLIVMECNHEKGPECPIWAADPGLVWDTLPNVGRDGDRYYRPMRIQGDYINYGGSVLFIDPSGRGKDETGYCVAKILNGYIYVLAAGGFLGGYTDENLQFLADLGKKFDVNVVQIEANFGDGMFTKLISPFFQRTHPCTIEEVRHSTQKELRIIDTLEPVLTQHRLVIDANVVRFDFESVQDRPEETAHQYMLMYQLTRITRDRGCLVHDDRLDALAMAVAYWTQHLERDVQKAVEATRRKAMEAELRKMVAMAGKRHPEPKWVHVREPR